MSRCLEASTSLQCLEPPIREAFSRALLLSHSGLMLFLGFFLCHRGGCSICPVVQFANTAERYRLMPEALWSGDWV